MIKQQLSMNTFKLIPENDDERYDNMFKICAEYYIESNAEDIFIIPFYFWKAKRVTVW
jgi:hypothetical protein